MTTVIRSTEPLSPPPLLEEPPFSSGGERRELDERVSETAKKHFDEFTAPGCVVCTVLAAEGSGVVRNALSIPAACVSPASAAGVGLGWAATPLYFIAGVIMAVVGGMLLKGCFADFKNAMKGNSAEETFRSSLNLFDKCALIAIGVALCFIGAVGTIVLVALLTATSSATLAFTASALSIGSTVFALLLTARGLEMIARGSYGLYKANKFQKQFQEHCQKGDAAQWLQAEMNEDSAAFKNRIGEKAAEALNKALENLNLDLSLDLELKQNDLQAYNLLMKTIDKGIFEEKAKQELFLSIGAVMFLGGVLSLLAIVLSHGIAAPLVGMGIGVAGSSFSLLTEGLWMPYDNPKWFQKWADWRYNSQEKGHLVEPPPSDAPPPEEVRGSDLLEPLVSAGASAIDALRSL